MGFLSSLPRFKFNPEAGVFFEEQTMFTDREDYEKVMKHAHRLTDLAHEMLAALEDIAGGSYSEEQQVAIARDIVKKITGKVYEDL